jgi:hypothetical protein
MAEFIDKEKVMTETQYSELKRIIDCGWELVYGAEEVDERTGRALNFIKEWPTQEAIKMIEQIRVEVENEHKEAHRINRAGHVSDTEYSKLAARRACEYLVGVLSRDQGNITS